MLFDNISKNKLGFTILMKYLAQFFLMGPITLFLMLLIVYIIAGVVPTVEFWDIGIEELAFLGKGTLCYCFFAILANILSVKPFVLLIIDLCCKSEIEIDCADLYFTHNYELNAFRESKRFVVDTLSRKPNAEIIIRDSSKTKYRLFWNVKYGGSTQLLESVSDAKRIRIKCFKRSKIIFACDIIE